MFEKVSKIGLSFFDRRLTEQEDFDKLKMILESLSYSNTEDSLEGILGGLSLVFYYEDQSKRYVPFNSKLMAIEGKTYAINRDICPEVRELFR